MQTACSGCDVPYSSAHSNTLLVACKDERALQVIDLEAWEVIHSVGFSAITGHEVAADSDTGLAYVPIYGDGVVGEPGSDGSSIDVVDYRGGKLVSTIQLPRPARPHCAVLDGQGRLLITTELTQSVTIVDVSTHEVLGQIPTGHDQAHMLAVSEDGTLGYTANVAPGTISVLDLPRGQLMGRVEVSARLNRISLGHDGRAYCADQYQARLAVIDTQARSVDSWLSLPAVGLGSAITPDGRALLIALRGAGLVVRLDLDTGKVNGQVAVPTEPVNVVTNGRIAYVSSSEADVVSAFDIESMELLNMIRTGRCPDGLAVTR